MKKVALVGAGPSVSLARLLLRGGQRGPEIMDATTTPHGMAPERPGTPSLNGNGASRGGVDMGSAGVDPLPAPAGLPRDGESSKFQVPSSKEAPKGWALIRVCMFCNGIMGAKEDRVRGAEIPLERLKDFRLSLGKAEAITSGVCEACLEGNALATWRGPNGAS